LRSEQKAPNSVGAEYPVVTAGWPFQHRIGRCSARSTVCSPGSQHSLSDRVAPKDLEIIVLRHQLAVLRRTTKPVVTYRDRSLLAAIARALPRARRDGWIVTPDALLRWHRDAYRPPMDTTTPTSRRPTVNVERDS
jgi:hypothetical protein